MPNKTLKEILEEQKKAKEAKPEAQAPQAPQTQVQENLKIQNQIVKAGANVPPKPLPLPTATKANPLAAALAAAKKPIATTPTVATVPSVPAPVPARSTISAEEYQHPSQPDGITDEEQIKLALQFLEESFDQPDQLKQAIQKIMMDIQAKPHLAAMLFPEDIGMCVRALREAHGVVLTEKELVNEKKVKAAKKVEDVENFMKGFGGFKLNV